MHECVQETEVAKKGFRKSLLEAVDEGLSMLGESGKKAVYFHLEKSFGIKKREIPCKIEDFADAIEAIFGLGAKIIEINILKHLNRRVGQVSQWLPYQEDLMFADCVKAVGKVFQKKVGLLK